MIVSNSHRFIFVHVMKTGGTTVCAALDASLRWNDVILGGTTFGERVQAPYRERFGLHKHSTAREIRDVVGEAVWRSYFTFALVRHPYARAISFYQWLGRTRRENPAPDTPPHAWPSMQAFAASRDFSEFVRHEKFLETAAARPQVEAVCDESGAPLVDFVGRLEEFDAAMRFVSDRIGFEWRPIERRNPSRDPRPAGELLSRADDYAYLERLFQRDFERFGYDPRMRFPAPA